MIYSWSVNYHKSIKIIEILSNAGWRIDSDIIQAKYMHHYIIGYNLNQRCLEDPDNILELLDIPRNLIQSALYQCTPKTIEIIEPYLTGKEFNLF